MMNIALTGYMASGKTTIGAILAKQLKYKFLDTDCIIEKKTKKTINDIFSEYGETYFRNIESEIIKECAIQQNCIISCGGGAVLNRQNIEALKKTSFVFNLNPSDEVIAERLSNAAATRPLLKKNDIEDALQRFHNRIPYYNFCDYKINVTTKKTPEALADEILEIYRRNI